MPAPLIEFAQFAQPHHWWLRRSPPPWMRENNPPRLSQSQELLKFAGPFVTFQSLTAIGLGIRLWWEGPVRQNETPS